MEIARMVFRKIGEKFKRKEIEVNLNVKIGNGKIIELKKELKEEPRKITKPIFFYDEKGRKIQ